MYDFRDYIAQESNMELLVHINPEGVSNNINPFDHGSALHTDIMKTQSLKMALDHYKFDVAFGGARRDEEESRKGAHLFFRNSSHRWDPKNQRPELRISIMVGKTQVTQSVYFRSQIGLNSTSGNTFIVSKFQLCHFTLHQSVL